MLSNDKFGNPTIHIAGENALIIYFSEHLDSEVSAKVQQAEQLIRKEAIDTTSFDIIDIVPSYASILVVFNLSTTDYHQIRSQLRVLLRDSVENVKEDLSLSEEKVVEIPVYYSVDSGPDLKVIAKQKGLTIEQVINIHMSRNYRVFAIGFAPGFAYLGEVDSRIASPRLNTPRMKVPKGAVAIADRQTAVYPSCSPGGWNLIGLSPIDMFDINATPIMPVKVGDLVRFTSITFDEFLLLGGELPNLSGL